jgi:type I restriction enzyme, S subunit
MIEGWDKYKLENLCLIVRGGSPRPINKFITNDKNGINWIKIGDSEKSGKYITSTSEKIIPEGVKKSRMVFEGDFLLSNSMSFGRPYIMKISGCIHDGWLLIRIQKTILYQDFLYYYLSSDFVFSQFNLLAGGSTVRNLNINLVKGLLINLPSLIEQRKISYILSTIQKAIEQQDKLIRSTTELKKALMQKLFTEGTKGEKQKQTEIGLVPEIWKVVELGDICERISTNIQPIVNGNKPYVGLEHIDSGAIYLSSFGKESEVVSSKSVFKKGEILYGKLRPYLDKAILAPFDGICSTDILVFSGRKEVQNEYLIHFFHTKKLIDFANSTTAGVQHPRTSWSSLKKLKIGLPDKEERRLIVLTLNSMEDKLSFYKKKKQTLTDLFKSLLHELMTGQRRVNEIDFKDKVKEYKLPEPTLNITAEN